MNDLVARLRSQCQGYRDKLHIEAAAAIEAAQARVADLEFLNGQLKDGAYARNAELTAELAERDATIAELRDGWEENREILRVRIATLEAAMRRLAKPMDCGCKPCTGQCRSHLAMEIEYEERMNIAKAALDVEDGLTCPMCGKRQCNCGPGSTLRRQIGEEAATAIKRAERIAALEADNADMGVSCAKTYGMMNDALRKVAAMQAALAKYGRHKDDCPCAGCAPGYVSVCLCGFQAALARAEGAKA